jgi:hypothetical protein
VRRGDRQGVIEKATFAAMPNAKAE